MSEIKEILSCLGRGNRDSEVRDTHLAQILSYLQQKKTEVLKCTISKLSLICGMQKRGVRENYLEGLIGFGIISIRVENNTEIWNWNGLKAFDKQSHKNNGEEK